MFELATINGARAIGRERDLGSLDVGKLADIVLVELDRPRTTPGHDLVSNLVFAATGANVDTVLVGVLRRAREAAARLQAQFRWPVASAWPIE